MVDLEEGKSSEQGGFRPAVVVSNDMCNANSPVITIVPLTGKLKKRLPTHVELDSPEYKLERPSVVMAEHVRTISKDRIVSEIGSKISLVDMKRLDLALKFQLSM